MITRIKDLKYTILNPIIQDSHKQNKNIQNLATKGHSNLLTYVLHVCKMIDVVN
jgi:hypothetical protein